MIKSSLTSEFSAPISKIHVIYKHICMRVLYTQRSQCDSVGAVPRCSVGGVGGGGVQNCRTFGKGGHAKLHTTLILVSQKYPHIPSLHMGTPPPLPLWKMTSPLSASKI